MSEPRKALKFVCQFQVGDEQAGQMQIGASDLITATIKAVAVLSEGPFETIKAILIQRVEEPGNIILPQNTRFSPPTPAPK